VGEKIVIRLLDSSAARLNIDQLGFDDRQKAQYLHALSKPQGMILVTGPTGSGKTVSLYTGLNILNTSEVNISTAEDPVEINLPGVNQVQINPKAGLTFASALRSFLRQDPDIVMVGEIRDLETAEIAIKAAQTGHLVLSTLHTNSAAETLTRMMNMGVPAFNIASSVTLIMAQRLARKLCDHCKAPEVVPEAELLELGFTQQQLAAGCGCSSRWAARSAREATEAGSASMRSC
jgi:type IV pilus assembly protein PilB